MKVHDLGGPGPDESSKGHLRSDLGINCAAMPWLRRQLNSLVDRAPNILRRFRSVPVSQRDGMSPLRLLRGVCAHDLEQPAAKGLDDVEDPHRRPPAVQDHGSSRYPGEER